MKLATASTIAVGAIFFGFVVGGCASSSPAGGSGGSGSATGGRVGGGAGTGGGAPSTGGRPGSGGVTGSGGSGGITGSGGSSSGSGGNVGSGGVATGGTPGSGGAGVGGGATGGGTGTGGIGGGGGGTATAPFTCPPGPFAAQTFTGLVPTRIATVPPSDAFNNNRNNFDIVDGPVWIGDSLYVSEIGMGDNINPPPARTLKVDSAGGVSILLDKGESGTNGLAVDAAGNLVACNHRLGSITRIALPGLAATQIVSSYGGMRFDSPNDLAFRADGNLYFTDPDWQAPAVRPQAKTRVYRVAPGATVATVVDDTLTKPNGITFSPDGNTMYVTGADGLFRYAVAADGTVGTRTKIVPSITVGDGMAIDCAGNLYVAANNLNTLVVLDPTGNMLGTITVPVGVQISNAAFGGTDHKTLYITTLGSGSLSGLFTLKMNVPGYPY